MQGSTQDETSVLIPIPRRSDKRQIHRLVRKMNIVSSEAQSGIDAGYCDITASHHPAQKAT